MNGKSPQSFVFDKFRLDAESRILSENGREIHLPKRPFGVLIYLVENRERLVSRDELLDKFWDGCDVYDDSLRKTVGAIRRALGDLEKPARFIETRYGSGYRFIGTVGKIPENTNGNGNHNGFKKDFVENSKPNRRNFPYVQAAIFLTSLLFFVSFSFYVYYPKDKVSSSPDNFTQNNAPVRSVAILPLKNLTGDAANEYFSDGITESIINELSRVNELKVTSRSSIFALKEKENDPQEIGRKLNVDALLEGSLQKKGETVSVSVRLISARDGSVLWTSQEFARPVSNAYELQDIIACNLANELRAKFCGDVSNRNTHSAEAYQAYLKGRYQWNKRTAEGIKKSIEFYEQAIAVDSNYALAYAGLAESYVQGVWHVPFDAKEVLPKAETASLKAVELDVTLAEAHTALANVYALEWNWAESEREIRRAVEFNPHYARAHHVLAFHYATHGRYEEALASIERARELDPLNLVINTDKAVLLFIANRDEEAFRQWRQTLDLDPNFEMVYVHRSIANYILGNEPAAIEDYAKILELTGKPSEEVAEFRKTSAMKGLSETYRKSLKDLLAQEKRGRKVSYFYIAKLYAILGNRDETFQYLEKAFQAHQAELAALDTERLLAPLRSDTRYADLKKRMGLPE